MNNNIEKIFKKSDPLQIQCSTLSNRWCPLYMIDIPFYDLQILLRLN